MFYLAASHSQSSGDNDRNGGTGSCSSAEGRQSRRVSSVNQARRAVDKNRDTNNRDRRNAVGGNAYPDNVKREDAVGKLSGTRNLGHHRS